MSGFVREIPKSRISRSKVIFSLIDIFTLSCRELKSAYTPSNTVGGPVFPQPPQQSIPRLLISVWFQSIFIKTIRVYYVPGPELSTRNVEMNRPGPDPRPRNLDMQTAILSRKCNDGTRYKGSTETRGVHFLCLFITGENFVTSWYLRLVLRNSFI